MNYKIFIQKAKKLRQKTFLTFIEKGEAHLGGSFSMIETLISLYDIVMKKEDKFILSKAHASLPLCLLLKEKGLNPPLTTHLEINPNNGIHCTTGSLGHGLPIGIGMALARKKMQKPGKIYVMISDGECQEGTTWESLLIGAKHKLDNLILLVDFNKIQALTTLEDGLPLDNLPNKFRAFNWNCIEVMDGHSFESIVTAFKENGFQEDRAINVLEIGSWQGMSANFILGYFKNARLTCVDTWDGADEHRSHDASDKSILSEIENTFDINIQEYSERVTKHKCTSYEFFNNFFEIDKFDLIYVDGSHHSDDVIVDAIKAFEMLKTDGVMILDDYFWNYYKNEIDNPAGAINSFLRLKKHQLKILCFDYQLVVKKTSSSVRWRE